MSKKIAINLHQAKPHLGRGRKEAIVKELSEKVGKAKGMVFANYQGLTHHQLEGLKRAVKKLDAEFVATKNTLLKRALGTLDIPDTLMQGPTATLFTYADFIEPIKALAKLIKQTKLPEIKFGFLSRGAGSGSARDGWETLTEADILKLSILPTLPQLRAQLVWTLNSPIQGLHRALNWNLVKLAMTLKAIETKKA